LTVPDFAAVHFLTSSSGTLQQTNARQDNQTGDLVSQWVNVCPTMDWTVLTLTAMLRSITVDALIQLISTGMPLLTDAIA